MCVNTKIQNLLQQKQELDAKIAKLEQFERAAETVRSLLERLIEEYQPIAPEELNDFLGEIAMMLSANETDEDNDPLGTRESVEAEFCEPSAEDIALVKQYREPNNPIPQEAAAAIESTLEENKFGFPPDPVDDREIESRDEEARSREAENMLAWGFTLWGEEQQKAFGELLPNPDDFVTTHKDWEIYFNIPNGGVVGIQLKSPAGVIYYRSTEIDEKFGFPEELSLDNFEGILTWTKQVINNLEYAIYPNGYFTKSDDPRIKLFSGSLELDSVKLRMEMSPLCHRVSGGDSEATTHLSGATFKFFSLDDGSLIFETQKTAEEIGDKQPMYLGLLMAIKWMKISRQEIINSSLPQKADDFAEFVKISNSVGYLKRKDNGLILSGYLGFSNKSENGDRAPSSAKPRADKWSNFLNDKFDGIKCEARKAKRIVSDIELMPFAYEVKIKGASIELLQKLTGENLEFSPLSTNELSPNLAPVSADSQAVKTWMIAVNGYTFKSFQDEQEARAGFESEILNLSPVCLVVELYEGATRLERWNFHSLSFTNCADFDELNPEFDVFHAPSNSKVKVWSSLRTANGKTERLWRHNLLQPGEEIELHTREAAAVHAIRRQQSTLQV